MPAHAARSRDHRGRRWETGDFPWFPHSLWWAIATPTTVGYGEVYPVTVGGKIFTFFVLLIGLGVVSVPAGLIASALGKARELEAVGHGG